MSKILVGIAALTLMGAATLPIQASAAERQQSGIAMSQSDEMSAQRRYHRRHYGYRHYGPRRHYGYYGPRRYYGPRYGYYDQPYRYGYRPYYPGVGVGVGPFGFRVF
jgi:hypothetical protein